MNKKRLRIQWLLQLCFFTALAFAAYLSQNILHNFDSNSEIRESQVRQQATQIVAPLQQRLNRIKIDIARTIERINVGAVNSFDNIKRHIDNQAKLDSLVTDITVTIINHGRHQHYSSAGKTITPVCNAPESAKGWRSAVSIDKSTSTSTLQYHYNPTTHSQIRCVSVTLNITNLIETFYTDQMSPIYHIVLDHDNRIAFHPQADYINQPSSRMLILDSLMSVVGSHSKAEQSIESWKLLSTVSPMENGQWKVATLTDSQSQTPDKHQADERLNELSKQIQQIKSMLKSQAQSYQHDPTTMLSVLRTKQLNAPLVDNFFFVDANNPNCLFDTTQSVMLSTKSLPSCDLFDNDTVSERITDKTKWLTTINTDKSLLHYQHVFEQQSPHGWLTIGFTLNLTKVLAQLSREPHLSQLFVILDQYDNVAYTPDFTAMIDTTGEIKGRLPISRVITGDEKLAATLNNVSGFDHANDTNYIFKQDTGQSLWVHNQSMDEGNWTISTVIETDVDSAAIEDRNQTWLLFILVVFVTLVLFSMVLFRISNGEIREFWQLVSIFSVLSVLAIGVIWGVQLNSTNPHEKEEYPIRDKTGLAQVLAVNKHQYYTKLKERKAPDVPTLSVGLRIDSLSFTSSGELNIIGLVWLNNKDCDSNITNSCVDLTKVRLLFPKVQKVEFGPHVSSDNNITKRFNLVMNFPLSSKVYPFERGLIPIRITTAGYNNPYRLIPDLSAYGMLNPVSKPALAEELELQGWRIFQSYFSYQPWLSTAKYATGDALYDGELTELYYNIEVGRKFLNPFIADMVPIIVIIALLFLVLMTMTNNEKLMSELGFSASSMLGYCSGLFFVLIVAHVYLREKLDIDTIAYIELFYFMMYFMLLSLSVCAILFSSRFQQKLVAYQDGIVIKLLFWPVIFIITLTFTFITFY